MTYNQVHYFRVNHLADFTQNGHTNPCRIAIHRSTNYMYGMSCTDSSIEVKMVYLITQILYSIIMHNIILYYSVEYNASINRNGYQWHA